MDARRIAAMCVVAACASAPPDEHEGLRIVDQSGAEFLWACNDHDVCEVHRIAGVSPDGPPECAESTPEPIHFAFGGRFFNVIGACRGVDENGQEGFGHGLDWGRYLVCEADDDCPPAYADPQFGDNAGYECHAGFCQSVDQEAFPRGLPTDSVMRTLCIGDRPRYEPIPDEAELRAALDAACPTDDEPCTGLPPGCPDPR